MTSPPVETDGRVAVDPVASAHATGAGGPPASAPAVDLAPAPDPAPGRGSARALRPASVLDRVPVLELGSLGARGAEQMALDERLLDGIGLSGTGATGVVLRRYTWTPAAVSLGKFQRVADDAIERLRAAGLDVARRPSGGRLVLHGAAFEWSFAVALPAGLLPYGTDPAYRLVAGAMTVALDSLGHTPDGDRGRGRDEPYARSALCFATALRHDLLLRGRKAVAVAQVRRGGRLLVHGSVLERRPPAKLVAAVEAALGEPWRGDGFIGSAPGRTDGAPDRELLWRTFVVALSDSLAGRSVESPADRDPAPEEAT